LGIQKLNQNFVLLCLFGKSGASLKSFSIAASSNLMLEAGLRRKKSRLCCDAAFVA
jgi:hypothetical protein